MSKFTYLSGGTVFSPVWELKIEGIEKHLHEMKDFHAGEVMTLNGHRVSLALKMTNVEPQKILIQMLVNIGEYDVEPDDTFEICGARWVLQCRVTALEILSGNQVIRSKALRFLGDPIPPPRIK